MLTRMRTFRLVRLLATLAMLAAVVRPYGNPTVCGLANATAPGEEQHHGEQGSEPVISGHHTSCHESMGCDLATVGLVLDVEPEIPTMAAHAEAVIAPTSSPSSSTILPTTPPPRA